MHYVVSTSLYLFWVYFTARKGREKFSQSGLCSFVHQISRQVRQKINDC